MKHLVLASSSPYRKQLLVDAGFRVETMPPGLDESKFKSRGLGPKDLAETLATEKARTAKAKLAALNRGQNAVLIGSDQVACLGSRIFDKPEDTEKAKQTLGLLSGQTHQLITSVCLLDNQSEYTFTDVTRLSMRSLSESQIEAYIGIDKPFDCAGSYKLEKAGIRLFEKIESEDFTAIQGLPMIHLAAHLRKLGFDF